ATSALRVVAGRHFPTDVVAGAVLGTLVGWTLPQVHRTQD
ncbi:MAG: phosphatase PAP2 family protein, partial [Gemmatimonadetes bacterium]|nr:phosphatase PAP2 family protein [Gemmatimonadota bacterium]